MMFYYRITRGILWAGPAILLFFCLWQYYGLSGVLKTETNFSSPAPLITDFFPAARVSKKADLSLIGEPVYFEVRMPRKFNSVKVELEYINKDQPVVYLGARQKNAPGEDINAWHYNLKMIENKLIDGLSWEKISHDGLTLYQRRARYSSLEEFFAQPPILDTVAVVNYDLASKLLLPSGESSAFIKAPARVFTNANRIAFRKPPDDERLQTILLNGKEVTLEEQHTLILEQGKGIKEIFVPKFDLEIQTDNVISFSKSIFSKVFPVKLQEGIGIEKDGIDFVLVSDYLPFAYFDIAPLMVKENKLRFMVSSPGLDFMKRSLIIKKIKVTFMGKPLWSVFEPILGSWSDIFNVIPSFGKGPSPATSKDNDLKAFDSK
jgi:hypothetical protein